MYYDTQNPGYHWCSLLNLKYLIDGTSLFSEALFGFSKNAIANEQHVALAKNRGLPDDLSETVEAEIIDIVEHERLYGGGEFGGYTYIEIDEFLNFVRQWEDEIPPDWQTIIQFINILARRPDYAWKKLRIVAWYCW